MKTAVTIPLKPFDAEEIVMATLRRTSAWTTWLQTAITIVTLISVSVKITQGFDKVSERVSLLDSRLTTLERKGSDLATKDHDILVRLESELRSLTNKLDEHCKSTNTNK